MTGRMERQLHAINGRRLPVILCRYYCVVVEPDPRKLLSGFRDKISSVTAIGMIGVSVSDDGFLNRLPRIDIKISLLAVQPASRKSYQPSPFHMRLFYRIEDAIRSCCYSTSSIIVSSN